MTDDMNPLENERLRRLLDAAATLPREVPPPADAWNAIRRQIETQRVVPIGPGAGRRADRGIAWWPIATAATVLLMVGFFFAMRGRGKAAPADFAGATRGGDTPRVIAPVPGPVMRDSVQEPARAIPATPVASVASNPVMAAAIEQYRQATRELEAVVVARTAALPPETREVVRRSLATIDAAISDLRTALGHDPANAAVGQYLTAVYERKLEFLKRVRAMPGAGM